jgi:hypothetical protein
MKTAIRIRMVFFKIVANKLIISPSLIQGRFLCN